MDDEWIGLMINASFHHGDKTAVSQEMCRIFGEDLLDVRLVTDQTMEQTGEYYCFVRCRDYGQHSDDVMRSMAVACVVQTGNEAHRFSERDIASFVVSIDERNAPEDFTYGDVVLVRGTHLKNLYGVVIEPGGKRCRVFFRLYMCTIKRLISVTSLEWCGNVLEQMRIEPFSRPVKRKSLFRHNMVERAKEAMENFVDGAKIHRQKRRAHAKAYGR